MHLGKERLANSKAERNCELRDKLEKPVYIFLYSAVSRTDSVKLIW